VLIGAWFHGLLLRIVLLVSSDSFVYGGVVFYFLIHKPIPLLFRACPGLDGLRACCKRSVMAF